MIEARGLAKVFGGKTAVDGITFDVQPGKVTGFLGPNGAGKSTTMRMIMGLDHPTAGSVAVNGRPYASHTAPLREVGALLEARAVHPRRTAYNHLRAMAATHGIPTKRVKDVIELTGLAPVATSGAYADLTGKPAGQGGHCRRVQGAGGNDDGTETAASGSVGAFPRNRPGAVVGRPRCGDRNAEPDEAA